MQSDRLNVEVNGEPRALPRGTTIAQLLAQLQMPERGLAVELNAQIVPKAQHGQQQLADGDRLEIVALVGGG